MAAGGRAHSLFVGLAGGLYAAGRNNHSQLGVANNDPECAANGDGSCDRPRAVPLPHEVRIVNAACGQNHSLGIDSEGRVWAWGCNDAMQLGPIARTASQQDMLGSPCSPCSMTCSSAVYPPRRVLLSRQGAVQAVAGHFHTAILDANGAVYLFGRGCPCPGNPLARERDPSSPISDDFEMKTWNLGRVTDIAAGARTTSVVALAHDGWPCRTVKQWGIFTNIPAFTSAAGVSASRYALRTIDVDESAADGETRYSDHLYAMCSDALSGARPPLHFIGVESQFKNS